MHEQDRSGQLPGLVMALREQQLSPREIETRSFEIISGLLPHVDQRRLDWPVIQRVVHSTGDPTIAHSLRIHPNAVQAALVALRGGRPIITDVRMVAAGISKRLAAKLGCEVVCAIDDPNVADLATRQGITRGAAAMVLLAGQMDAATVAIGNAPTALFALRDLIRSRNANPALIIGTPVGFVGAAEAKAELVALADTGVPYITLEGTRGGSAVAVAAVNALLRLAADRSEA